MASCGFEKGANAKVILLDIEGTTTPITFVKDVLFPYAERNVAAFLEDHWHDTQLQHIIQQLRKECENDISNGTPNVPAIIDEDPQSINVTQVQQSVVANVLWQMKNDLKRTPLKALQGKIWNVGFAKGELQGHLFEDVLPAFQQWTKDGKQICIYSSGSVEAQKLLFKFSVVGDMSAYICGYFDTNVGPKVECESYTTIAANLNVHPSHILFVTDIPKEASAATEAGVPVVVMIREGNAPLSALDHQTFTTLNSFDQFHTK